MAMQKMREEIDRLEAANTKLIAQRAEDDAEMKRMCLIQKQQTKVLKQLQEVAQSSGKCLDEMVASTKEQTRVLAQLAGEPEPRDEDSQEPEGSRGRTIASERKGVPSQQEAPPDGATGGLSAEANERSADAGASNTAKMPAKRGAHSQCTTTKATATVTNKSGHAEGRKGKKNAEQNKSTPAGDVSPPAKPRVTLQTIAEGTEAAPCTNRPCYEGGPVAVVNQLSLFRMTEKGHFIAGRRAFTIQFDATAAAALAKACRKDHGLFGRKVEPADKICNVAIDFAKRTLLDLLEPLMPRKPLFVMDGIVRYHSDQHKDVGDYLVAQPDPTKSVAICTLKTLSVANAPKATKWLVAEAAVGACGDVLYQLQEGFDQAHPTEEPPL